MDGSAYPPRRPVAVAIIATLFFALALVEMYFIRVVLLARLPKPKPAAPAPTTPIPELDERAGLSCLQRGWRHAVTCWTWLRANVGVSLGLRICVIWSGMAWGLYTCLAFAYDNELTTNKVVVLLAVSWLVCLNPMLNGLKLLAVGWQHILRRDQPHHWVCIDLWCRNASSLPSADRVLSPQLLPSPTRTCAIGCVASLTLCSPRCRLQATSLHMSTWKVTIAYEVVCVVLVSCTSFFSYHAALFIMFVTVAIKVLE